jgi:hypothetical protein
MMSPSGATQERALNLLSMSIECGADLFRLAATIPLSLAHLSTRLGTPALASSDPAPAGSLKMSESWRESLLT